MSNQRRQQRTVVVRVVRLFCLLISLLFAASAGLAQSTAFTYQGRLTDGGTPANGNYDLQFQLFDSGGTQVGTTQTLNVVPVSAGIFTVTLDFGANAFPGANRFLDISARMTGAGAFTPLTPRQPISATPYAVRSLNTGSADALSSACGGCVSDANIAGLAASKLTGTIPVSALPSGSGAYVQNSTSQQASSNFNITGDGKAAGTLSGNIISATTQFNIGSSRVLSMAGVRNLFAGLLAGAANTGDNNSFFGVRAGNANSTGSQNAFFGSEAGPRNTTGLANAFFGNSAGLSNTNGDYNAFFGVNAGEFNGSGGQNAFFGTGAGSGNNGSNNTAIGTFSSVGNNLTNATAVGFNALVTQSNSLVLGSINGANSATADTKVGIGITAPVARFHVVTSSTNAADNTATFAAPNIGPISSHIHYGPTGNWFIRSAATAGKVVLQDTGGNVGIGTATPNAKLQVAGGSVYIGSPNSLIITSPNGACWFITVNNAGALSTISVTCP